LGFNFEAYITNKSWIKQPFVLVQEQLFVEEVAEGEDVWVFVLLWEGAEEGDVGGF
jgi:hypothetical protein